MLGAMPRSPPCAVSYRCSWPKAPPANFLNSSLLNCMAPHSSQHHARYSPASPPLCPSEPSRTEPGWAVQPPPHPLQILGSPPSPAPPQLSAALRGTALGAFPPPPAPKPRGGAAAISTAATARLQHRGQRPRPLARDRRGALRGHGGRRGRATAENPDVRASSSFPGGLPVPLTPDLHPPSLLVSRAPVPQTWELLVIPLIAPKG